MAKEKDKRSDGPQKVIKDDTPDDCRSEKDAELQISFGANLRKVRKQFFNNASQASLGSQVFDKYGQNTMFQLEGGKGSLMNVLKLLRHFHENGVNLNFLFSEHGDDAQMFNYNVGAGDTLFAQQVVGKYEMAINNLIKCSDTVNLLFEKNISDFQKQIESINTVVTMESIDLEN